MDSRGLWRINTVNFEHNHKTSPSKSRLYRCNRELSEHVKRRLEVNDMAGIPLHKSFNSAVVEADFEEGWRVMIDTYDLHENTWLLGLYENRCRWVPCFFKTSFWASMSTTQRSESMNAFFDGYVHSKTSLKQFINQYERALRSKVEKEIQADFRSFSQMVPCATRHMIAVLIRNGAKQIPDKYILRRWRRDVSRVHMRVVVNYDGLITTPGQLRYDKLCQSFATLADLVADDESKPENLQKWIDHECELVTTSKSNVVSNILSPHGAPIASQCGPSLETITSG
ncbi:uncharacterized protein LOC111390703 [Olea europaea var. sylvestris]|uniref:uncharacterized protein LOC111390703 n=1 Tax=Olea europaea var. sylvestris TaxID=158386 RepID=UPI000C1D0C0D|nr:uncharacterized protein LOC111390703 [Olea europaea var. sylvestris]